MNQLTFIENEIDHGQTTLTRLLKAYLDDGIIRGITRDKYEMLSTVIANNYSNNKQVKQALSNREKIITHTAWVNHVTYMADRLKEIHHG